MQALHHNLVTLADPNYPKALLEIPDPPPMLYALDNLALLQMGHDPVGIDTLTERSGLTGENLSAMLMVLELEGKIAPLPGGRYQRIT